MPDLAAVARLVGEPVRLKMLFSLLDGDESPASELAHRAGASPSSASAHLGKLVNGGLLAVRNEGRQRLFRLKTPEIARAIEVLASLAPEPCVSSLNQHTAMARLRIARSCYDHLAGRLGVAVTDALIRERYVNERGALFDVTPQGRAFFAAIGINVDHLRHARRPLARACLDWTERRHHLAGSLGEAILTSFLDREWVARHEADRSLRITPVGEREIVRLFGVRLT